MRTIFLLLSVLLLSSCVAEDDYQPLSIEPVFSDKLDVELTIDIVYIKNPNSNDVAGKFNEQSLIADLNGKYFHRHQIGFTLGNVSVLENEELSDFTDNRDEEQETFLNETETLYTPGRITVFVIKRANIYGIAGMGYGQRVLITDEHVFESTTAHEIGHTLGLGHTMEEGNLMCTIKPHLRKSFTTNQVHVMKQKIKSINKLND
ncbi:matrixin family metalloprotease [Aquimarina brevivitae]|uniref:Matrixin n=1 Tax=Aquimarina brevivitae TaxID=323412 RepID=A0A4Q7NXF2_9FLAO|nr:matrixin family metalloprotease [Aquimarina brevivitae]RZS91955.1 matrixin [Aquimarina brevivitae]